MSGDSSGSSGRPNYVHHVLEYPTETWCGKKVALFALEFVFQNATHAIVNGKNEGRMLVCPECAEAMVKALRAGTWTEPSVQRVQVRDISATFEVQVRSNVTWILFSTPSRPSMVEFGDTLNAWLRSAGIRPLTHGTAGGAAATGRARAHLTGEAAKVTLGDEEVKYALLVRFEDAPKVLSWIRENSEDASRRKAPLPAVPSGSGSGDPPPSPAPIPVGPVVPPTCAYCGKPTELVGGEAIYPHRPDLFEKSFYQCLPCAAYVGCHPGTTNPLGRVANAELRKAKNAAHTAFDPLWRSGGMKRKEAYIWLSKAMDLPEAHIGEFDILQCDRVVQLSTAKLAEVKAKLELESAKETAPTIPQETEPDRTGFAAIDDVTDGLKRGELWVQGGNPSAKPGPQPSTQSQRSSDPRQWSHTDPCDWISDTTCDCHTRGSL